MKRLPVGSLIIAGLLVALVFTTCSSRRALASLEAVHLDERERIVEELAATEAGLRRADEERSIAFTALRDSLAAERSANEALRTQARRSVAVAAAAGAAALDSARAHASEQVAVYLDEHERMDSLMVAGYEQQVATLEEDVAGLELTLAEAEALAAERLEGWNAATRRANLAQGINDGLRRAYERQRVTGAVTKWAAVVGAGKVCYDAANRGQTSLAVGSCAVAVLVGIGG